MGTYKERIAAVIGAADLPTLTLVEELMRTDRTGLDGLTGAQFDLLARKSYGDAQLLAAAGELRTYCEALGLAVPTRFSMPNPSN